MPDLLELDRLAAAPSGTLGLSLYRRLEDPADLLRLKLFRRDQQILLSDALPILENMGLKVLSERAARDPRRATASSSCTTSSCARSGPTRSRSTIGARPSVDAFAKVWSGAAESDGFNRLVLLAGLDARAVTVLRAYCKYLLQIGSPFSQAYIEQTLASNPRPLAGAGRPVRGALRPGWRPTAGRRPSRPGILAGLERVQSLDEDRILRRYLGLIQATLRTNHFQPGPDGEPKDYLSLKFDLARGAGPAACRTRSTRSSSTARPSRPSTCAAARSRAAASAGPTGARTSAPRSWA